MCAYFISHHSLKSPNHPQLTHSASPSLYVRSTPSLIGFHADAAATVAKVSFFSFFFLRPRSRRAMRVDEMPTVCVVCCARFLSCINVWRKIDLVRQLEGHTHTHTRVDSLTLGFLFSRSFQSECNATTFSFICPPTINFSFHCVLHIENTHQLSTFQYTKVGVLSAFRIPPA